ncbi:UNVERIFIED_CONTAM: hypothetical protein Sangu_3129300 [Sesamum angustifolium]|uniref:AP complex mu/sigma subunit domain-containing protein n=1 Tax=Sesamum angustifolium TaxID=2727405 RepID=A0AAW2K0P8_9LAMI
MPPHPDYWEDTEIGFIFSKLIHEMKQGFIKSHHSTILAGGKEVLLMNWQAKKLIYYVEVNDIFYIISNSPDLHGQIFQFLAFSLRVNFEEVLQELNFFLQALDSIYVQLMPMATSRMLDVVQNIRKRKQSCIS